jgi:prephenate dehydrogenase
VAVLGLGLLGGSVALAARRAGVAGRLVAAGRRRAPLEQALASGVVDAVDDVAGAVRGADLVVLATPVGSMARLLREAAPHLAEGTIVTDVGSVKELLTDTLPGLLPPGVHFVGAHPMAGSHHRGVGHARADLFDGSCCVLTPLRSTDASACERVAGFWRALGARVTQRDPAGHDSEVAWVSHVPHVLAFAFARALASAPAGAGELAGAGFRDFTRIAHSDAEMWGEILSANRKALAGPLEAFNQSLQDLCRVIEDGDGDAQERFLSDARETLDRVARKAPWYAFVADERNARSGGDNPEIKAGPERLADPRSS